MVGSGAAGLTAAYLLDPLHQVTLFEKEDRLGGHTNTIVLPSGPDAGTPVDTGFIVFNNENYPNLCRLFEKLNIETSASDMAFGITSPQMEYCSDFPGGLFAWKRNALNPRFLAMIRDILRMNDWAKADACSEKFSEKTLGQWLDFRRAGKAFRNFYLLPMGAAIWSAPAGRMLDFPAATFLRFFDNHRLWDLKDRPRWRFVAGGANTYVEKIRSSLKAEVRLSSGVLKIRRTGSGVEITTAGSHAEFDAVVIAAHADQVLEMLEDPSEEELEVFRDWKYSRNEAVLHWDEKLMPRRRAAWASWNCRVSPDPEEPVVLTYWMNRLQNLKTVREYFVTLNASAQIDPAKIIRKISYTHPQYDFAALNSQKKIPGLNGKQHTYFCGSYCGYGFHEDAVKSAVQAASRLGASF